MFHYTLLYFLRMHPCLFVGLSLRDDNIRRLLHYSQIELQSSIKERSRQHDELQKTIAQDRQPTLRHYAVMKRTKDPRVDQLTERSLGSLGVQVLWLDCFEQLPSRLGEVYGSGGECWDSVYEP